MSVENASPPSGGQGAPPASPPAAPPPENVSPPAAPPPPPAPEAPKPYYSEWKNPELRGYAERKGWKDPEAITESFLNLEKFHGVPADQLLKLPAADKLSDPEVIRPILERIGYGVPKEAKEYGFADVPGIQPERANMLADLALKHNVPKATAAALLSELATLDAAALEAETAAQAEQVAVEMGALKAEWGANYDERLEAGRRFARSLGITEEQLANLEASVGAGDLMRVFWAGGAKLSEAPFVEGTKKKADLMTPEAAYSEIQALRNDKAFADRLLAGDQVARQRWDRLNQIASSLNQGPTP